jgi:flagellar biosynthesis protein FlhA
MTTPQAIATPQAGGLPKVFAKFGDMGVPLAVVAIVIALITPLPPMLLDFLLVIDIMLSVIVLMVSLYLLRPVEFNVFPTALLLLTLFRLALNVSSSRLILLNGNMGTSAAGHVIESFGNFVVGGNYIIGTVIFLILIAIQYVVINHGAVRISEVTARFTLDALPGKQMSIDSDLNSGLIDEAQARQRRKELAAEAEFYGAMDGASRFTQRDAMASILITAINIIAGFLIGVLQHDMDLKRAIRTYTVLTIGDGLVTVIPALMISISGGMIITRSSSDNRLSSDVGMQVFGKPQPLMLASGVLIALAAFPGLPGIPFLITGSGLGWLAWSLRKKAVQEEEQAIAAAPVAAPPREDLEEALKVEPLTIELGLGLVKLVQEGEKSPLLRRVAAIRRQLASDLGYILPPLRLKDNLSRRAHEYAICIRGVEISSYELSPGCELAIAVGKPSAAVDGKKTHEPAFGIPAIWIPAERSEEARKAGYTTIDAVTVISTHISEFARRYAHELFSRQDLRRLLDRVTLEHPKLVEELVPKLLSQATVHRVFQNLLRERVSVRDVVSIVDALSEAAATTRNSVLLTEFVRQSLRRSVVKPYLNKSGQLPAYFLEAQLERGIEAAVEHGEQHSHLNASPEIIRALIARIEKTVQKPEAPVVLITGSGPRFFIRQILETSLPNLFVLSHNEIPSEMKVVSLGVIS